MRRNAKRLLYVLLLNIFGGAGLIAPLVGAVLCIQKRQWGAFLLFVICFFIVKQVLFVIENKLNVRSASNPEARKLGSGITFIAPWLRSKNEKANISVAKKNEKKGAKAEQENGGTRGQ